MKTSNILSLIFGVTLASWGCQPQEVAPLFPKKLSPVVEDKLTVVKPNSTPSVVRTDYPGAIKWEITIDVNGFDYMTDWLLDYQYHFSIIHESFHSINDMNLSARYTSVPDIALNCFEFMSIDQIGDKLDYPEYATTTWFKTVDIRPAMIEHMTTTAPQLFQSKYKSSPELASKLVSNYEEAMYDTHLFKIEHATPRYGLIRMLDRSNAANYPSGFKYYGKIEIVVQK